MTAIKSSGNIFADLGFDAEEAANLKLRSQLMIEVDNALLQNQMTQQAAAKALGISQPGEPHIRAALKKRLQEKGIKVVMPSHRSRVLQLAHKPGYSL